MKRTTYRWALVLLLIAGGCAGITDLSISTRNRSAAYKAWREARWGYWEQGVPHKLREHIGRGFQEGYYSVANGGKGDVPLFPPGYYWGAEYQNPQGNELIAAWFRGYADGALAAEQSGIGGYHNLPTSWAPRGALDPNTPYNHGMAPLNEGLGPNGEMLPPSLNDPNSNPYLPPQLPAPSRANESLPPLPMQKSAGTPIPTDGLPPAGVIEVKPGGVTPSLTAPPSLSAPQTVTPPKTLAVTPTPPATPKTEAPAGKQTFLPPGSPKPSIVDVPAVPQLGASSEAKKTIK